MTQSSAPQIVKVLLVDDRRENLLVLESLLKDASIEIFKANSGREALELLLVHDFGLALLDVQMPEINGFELAELMRGAAKTKMIPIIFVTAGAIDPTHTFKGYEAGAVDFLYKPLDARIVRSKVRVFTKLQQQKMQIEQQINEVTRALQAREDFLSIASHELKTPISSITLQMQLVRRGINLEDQTVPSAEKLAKSLDMVGRQLKKLTALIDDLLDVSRIQAGKLVVRGSEVDLGAHIREISESFRDQFLRVQSPLELEIEANVQVMCDPFRVEQVVVNLLSNALKYAAGSKVKVSLERQGDFAQLRVCDEGGGIAPEQIATIFERFERASTQKGIHGLGLGLFIVKQIMKAHGGEISVESKENQGTQFTANFPLRPKLSPHIQIN